MKNFRKKYLFPLRDFGPGIVTGAADDDPSGIVTYTIAGAQFGSKLLWTSWFTWPLMAAVQLMCARVVLASRMSLTAALGKKLSARTLLVLIIALFIANTLNVAADLAGMGDALKMILGFGYSSVYAAALAIIITAMMIHLNYQQITRVLIWLTCFLFSYIFTAFHADTDWHEIFSHSLYPHIPKSATEWATVVAIFGTTISPYLFFWQAAQEVEEIDQKKKAGLSFSVKNILRIRRWDIYFGTFVSNVIMFFVIIAAGNSLFKAGITNIETSKQAAEALVPLLGKAAAFFYTLGLLGVGLLAVPTLSGSAAFALADYFHWHSGLDQKWRQAKAFYAVIVFSTIGAVLIEALGINPIKALFWSSVLNGMLSPILIVLVLWVSCDKKIMGANTLSWPNRLVVSITAALMIAAAIGFFYFL